MELFEGDLGKRKLIKAKSPLLYSLTFILIFGGIGADFVVKLLDFMSGQKVSWFDGILLPIVVGLAAYVFMICRASYLLSGFKKSYHELPTDLAGNLKEEYQAKEKITLLDNNRGKSEGLTIYKTKKWLVSPGLILVHRSMIDNLSVTLFPGDLPPERFVIRTTINVDKGEKHFDIKRYNVDAISEILAWYWDEEDLGTISAISRAGFKTIPGSDSRMWLEKI